MTRGSRDPALRAARTEAMRRIEANGVRAGHLAISQWMDLQPKVPDHRRLADELIAELRAQPFMAPFGSRQCLGFVPV
jgi:hypothetical protein